MNPSNRSPARELVRVGAGSGWSPEPVFEIVAHRDEQYLSITVTTTSAAGGHAHMEQFQCADAVACRRLLRDWLVVLALRISPVDPRMARWADDIAGQVVAAAFAAPR